MSKTLQNEKQLEQLTKSLAKHKNILNVIFLYAFGLTYLAIFIVWIINIAFYQWLTDSQLTLVASFFGGISIGNIIIDKVANLLK